MVTQSNTLHSLSSEQAAKREGELKAWIKELEGLHEIFLDAFCVVDILGNVVEFNVAFSELVGESHRKILKIGKFSRLLKTELGEAQCPTRQIFTSQRSIRLDELRGETKAHSSLKLILAGVPVFSPSKELLGALLTIRNVSAEDELQRKYLKRKTESMTDGLTQLYNKTFVEDAISQFVNISLNDKSSFSLIMMDVDHFKKINDTYGHPAGDYVLTTLGKLLREESRGSDVAGRFGGEEFVIVLSQSSYSGCRVFAERVRNIVANKEFVFEGKKIPVTVSLGTATFDGTWRPGLPVEEVGKEIIKRADKALYVAKRSGRNQTSQFEGLPNDKRHTD